MVKEYLIQYTGVFGEVLEQDVNYGKSSKKKKAAGDIVKLSNGGLTRRSHRKRPAGNSGIARGCGVVKRRKVTKYV